MTLWVIAGLLALATGLRIGWALVNKQSLVSSAMIVALGSLGALAALNWPPLALLVDTLLGWPNISVGLSQVALVACAAGSCVMITTVASARSAVLTRRIAWAQYALAVVVAAISLALFLSAGRSEPQMPPADYLRRNFDTPGVSLHWLVPTLYVMLALTLVAWAGLRHSSTSRRGRALFVFSVGIVLIVLSAGFFLMRAVWAGDQIGIGAGVTMLGGAMLVVAAGALLPSVEDWFGARRELRVIDPLLTELDRRQPNIGVGVRPRGPLVFRVAERMSLISDALFLEASAAYRHTKTAATGSAEGAAGAGTTGTATLAAVTPDQQALAVAAWIESGEPATFPGLDWMRQPSEYSDREWILAIAQEYRGLVRS